jgi:hypothetical protein
VAAICHGIAQLWGSTACIQNCTQSPAFIIKAIEEPLARLHHEARALRLNSSPAVKATAVALQIVLYLSWSAQTEMNVASLASELKMALCMMEVRTCSDLNFTSFQLMIGAIAAEVDSLTRTWFLTKLKTAILVLKSRGLDAPLKLFNKVLIPEANIMLHLTGLWEELLS